MVKRSSDVKNYFYNQKEKELYIEFNSGSSYKYKDVSKQRFKAFDKADSLGEYVNKKLNPNYKTDKL